MNKIKLIIAGTVAAATMATGTAVVNAQSNTANKCSAKPAALGQWGKAFTVNGNKVTATFTVEGTNCTVPVNLAVWERPTAEGINDQVFNNYSQKTFGPGKHSLTATLPNCMWQADVVEGSNPKAADGTANYQYQNGKFVDGGLRDFLKGGYGICETPEKPEKPEKPQKPDEPKKEIPKTPVTPTEVKELPNTGAGSILASTMGLSTTAGLAVRYYQSRRSLK